MNSVHVLFNRGIFCTSTLLYKPFPSTLNHNFHFSDKEKPQSISLSLFLIYMHSVPLPHLYMINLLYQLKKITINDHKSRSKRCKSAHSLYKPVPLFNYIYQELRKHGKTVFAIKSIHISVHIKCNIKLSRGKTHLNSNNRDHFIDLTYALCFINTFHFVSTNCSPKKELYVFIIILFC